MAKDNYSWKKGEKDNGIDQDFLDGALDRATSEGGFNEKTLSFTPTDIDGSSPHQDKIWDTRDSNGR
jgi:hypothetical protein